MRTRLLRTEAVLLAWLLQSALAAADSGEVERRTPGVWSLPQETTETPVFYMLAGGGGKGVYPALIAWESGRVLWIANYNSLFEGTTVSYPDPQIDSRFGITQFVAGPYLEANISPSLIENEIQYLREMSALSDYGTDLSYPLRTGKYLTITVDDDGETLTLPGFLDSMESGGDKLVLESGIAAPQDPAEREALLASQSVGYLRFRLVYGMLRAACDDLVAAAEAEPEVIERGSLTFKDRFYPLQADPAPLPTPSPTPPANPDSQGQDAE